MRRGLSFKMTSACVKLQADDQPAIFIAAELIGNQS
jgi:hypothetical protein